MGAPDRRGASEVARLSRLSARASGPRRAGGLAHHPALQFRGEFADLAQLARAEEAARKVGGLHRRMPHEDRAHGLRPMVRGSGCRAASVVEAEHGRADRATIRSCSCSTNGSRKPILRRHLSPALSALLSSSTMRSASSCSALILPRVTLRRTELVARPCRSRRQARPCRRRAGDR